jgi:LacI family transcriptional regulator
MVTIRDVAREAGVSQATAARALGAYGYTSDASRVAVIEAASRLHYRLNGAARTLASGSSNLVGFVVGDIENSFFSTAARGLADAMEEFGYTLLIANSDEDVERERRAVSTLREYGVDGLVVAPTDSSKGAHLADAAKAGLPVVLLDRTVRGLQVDSVVSDGAVGTRMALEHLLGQGHRRIGIIIDFIGVPLSSLGVRLKAWKDTLRDAGVSYDDSLISTMSGPMQDGYEATNELLDRRYPPTAIFTATNFATDGALRAIRDRGMSMPRDLSLVAFDDNDWSVFAAHLGRSAAGARIGP